MSGKLAQMQLNILTYTSVYSTHKMLLVVVKENYNEDTTRENNNFEYVKETIKINPRSEISQAF